jgi:glutamyl-tRNA synthetase
MANIDALIEKFTLANAFQYGGKAQPGSIIGKLISEDPKIKAKLKEIMPKINKIISEINKLSIKQQEEKLLKIYPEFFEKKEHEEKQLKDMPNAVKGKVVMRLEPSFSGRMHIGHAFPLSLNYSYVKKYDGKLIIRLADTNPKSVELSAYKGLPEDANWLTSNGVDQVVIQSDRMPLYYKYAEEFIKKGFAYICMCDPEKWKKLTLAKTACPCRSIAPKENLERWKHMLKDYKEGEAVLRIKTDIKHPNPAIRDWPAARIIVTPHPRQGKKYRVWPLMNLSVAIDDHELGITHAIRAKEHIDNEKRQLYLYRYMNWKAPTQLYVGRIKFEGMELSKSKIRSMIESGKYSGWDDVRLPTLLALKRRGYQPHAIVDFFTDMGVSEVDKNISSTDFFKLLDAANRKLIDPIAHRYSFIPTPVKIKIDGAPKIKEITAKLHPDNDKELKTIKVGKSIFIPHADLQKYGGTEVRLMHLYNIILNKKAKFTSEENKPIQKIQWVSDDNIKTSVLMPDGEVIDGLAEANVEKLKIGDIIQFERFGFVRLDKKEKNKLTFCYTHN